MTTAVLFLEAIERLLSLVALQGAGHPGRLAKEGSAYRTLDALLAEHGTCRFDFGDSTVHFQDDAVHGVAFSPWNRRLAGSGIEHLEFTAGIGQEEFSDFVGEVTKRLNVFTVVGGRSGTYANRHVSFGLRAAFATTSGDEGWRNSRDPGLEKRVIRRLHAEASSWGRISTVLAKGLTLHLSKCLPHPTAPLGLLQPADDREYDETHPLNVATLAMALCRSIQPSSPETLGVGIAALLHDVGKATVATSAVNHPGRMTRDDWTHVRLHPVRGARILLRSGLTLPALVAYEHHVTREGGYPRLKYATNPLPTSRLVQVCDVFDALRSPRPYRKPWPAERTLDHLKARSGTHFDPMFVSGFIRMVRERGLNWEETTA